MDMDISRDKRMNHTQGRPNLITPQKVEHILYSWYGQMSEQNYGVRPGSNEDRREQTGWCQQAQDPKDKRMNHEENEARV